MYTVNNYTYPSRKYQNKDEAMCMNRITEFNGNQKYLNSQWQIIK